MSARPAAALALLCALVLTSLTYLERTLERRITDRTHAHDRYVDAHVRLHVVAKDPEGRVTDPSKLPRIRTHSLGGWIDTKCSPPRLETRPGSISAADTIRRLGPGVDWYCSADQEQLILHPDSAPVGKLALGGMGAGKTTAGVIWTYLRWLEGIQARTDKPTEGGITAPTSARLKIVVDEIIGKFPAAWYRYTSTEGLFTMCDGSLIRCVSTYRQSASQGSRIQGFNWSWWLGDELQDQTDEYINIQARLRAAKTGRAKRLATATAKDSPEWRTFKDSTLSPEDWVPYQMLGPHSPFIAAEHWASMRRGMSERDYKRLVLAEDLPSESRLYSAFDRKENLRPLPIGANKITSYVLSKRTGNPRHALLVGHDPGVAKAASIYLDAFTLKGHGSDVFWWVRGELFTLHESAESHAIQVLKWAREHGINRRPDGEIAHVRAQPVGAAEDKPDLDMIRIWRRVGLDVRPAQYKKNDSIGVGQIKKESRIGMLNSLFCNADGKRRLFIECNDRGVPVAPNLVAALETMERDERGRAEHEEKDVRHDKSDLPAALGYGLWPFEKEAAIALRLDIEKGLG